MFTNQREPISIDICKTHKARTENFEIIRTACPANLTRKELEDVYYNLYDNNLYLKTKLNTQDDQIKSLNNKLLRMTNTPKSSGNYGRSCCSKNCSVITEQRDMIQELKLSNERLIEKNRQLNRHLCSAKQFLKGSSCMRCPKCRGKMNASMSFGIKRSDVCLKPAISHSCPGAPDPNKVEITSRTIGTVTNSRPNSAKSEENTCTVGGKCPNKRCCCEIQELKQRITELENEVINVHEKHLSSESNTERQVIQIDQEKRQLKQVNEQLEQKIQEITQKLNALEQDRNELRTQLTIEKRKVTELETRVRLSCTSSEITRVLRKHLSQKMDEELYEEQKRRACICNRGREKEIRDEEPYVEQSSSKRRNCMCNRGREKVPEEKYEYECPKGFKEYEVPKTPRSAVRDPYEGHSSPETGVFKNSDDSGYAEVVVVRKVQSRKGGMPKIEHVPEFIKVRLMPDKNDPFQQSRELINTIDEIQFHLDNFNKAEQDKNIPSCCKLQTSSLEDNEQYVSPPVYRRELGSGPDGKVVTEDKKWSSSSRASNWEEQTESSKRETPTSKTPTWEEQAQMEGSRSKRDSTSSKSPTWEELNATDQSQSKRLSGASNQQDMKQGSQYVTESAPIKLPSLDELEEDLFLAEMENKQEPAQKEASDHSIQMQADSVPQSTKSPEPKVAKSKGGKPKKKKRSRSSRQSRDNDAFFIDIDSNRLEHNQEYTINRPLTISEIKNEVLRPITDRYRIVKPQVKSKKHKESKDMNSEINIKVSELLRQSSRTSERSRSSENARTYVKEKIISDLMNPSGDMLPQKMPTMYPEPSPRRSSSLNSYNKEEALRGLLYSPSSPEDTESDVSLLTDLPTEKTDSSEPYPGCAGIYGIKLSIGEERGFPGSSSGRNNPDTTSLSEGEVPMSRNESCLSLGEKRHSSITNGKVLSPDKMKQTISAMSKEMLRCRRLMQIVKKGDEV